MTLNVTSGIVYSSGPVLTVNATPVNIFGAAGTSGTAAITHYSGALNVNISGGSLSASVSGNIVLVVSGGAIQVSGLVTVAGSGGIPIMAESSGANANLRVSIWNAATELFVGTVAGDAIDPTSVKGVVQYAFPYV